MTRVPVVDAKDRLNELVARACAGEEVVIEAEGAAVELVPRSTPPRGGLRNMGWAKGLITYAPNWDAPMTDEELEEWERPIPKAHD